MGIGYFSEQTLASSVAAGGSVKAKQECSAAFPNEAMGAVGHVSPPLHINIRAQVSGFN